MPPAETAPESPSAICFGLDRETDERSLAQFVRRFAGQELLARLVPRLEEDEILQLVDTLTAVMRRHLSENEYHRLFLGDGGHS